MNWFFFAVFSVIAMTGSEITQKIALTRKVDISAITNNAYIWLLQGTGGFILSLIFGQFSIPLGWQNWLKLFALALVYFVGGTAFYTSYKSNSPSISIVLASISVVISSTLGILFFGESTSLVKFLGIGLILSSILIVNLKKDKLKVDKYNGLALLGGICFGIAFSIDKSFVVDLNPFAYLGFMSLSVGLLSFAVKARHIMGETKTLHLIDFIPIFVIAAFGITFNLFTFISYSKGGSVGVVDAINNTTVFFVILAEIFLLKDKTDLQKKFVSASIAVIGLVLLSGL